MRGCRDQRKFHGSGERMCRTAARKMRLCSPDLRGDF
jgi:hypothetical protein